MLCCIVNGLFVVGFVKEVKVVVWVDNDVIGWSCVFGMWCVGFVYILVNGCNVVVEN